MTNYFVTSNWRNDDTLPCTQYTHKHPDSRIFVHINMSPIQQTNHNWIQFAETHAQVRNWKKKSKIEINMKFILFSFVVGKFGPTTHSQLANWSHSISNSLHRIDADRIECSTFETRGQRRKAMCSCVSSHYGSRMWLRWLRIPTVRQRLLYALLQLLEKRR